MVAVFSILSASCKPTATDISPDVPAGPWSTAGLTFALAGNDQALYAVSLSAGVWKLSKPTQTWHQLVGSPRYAMSIAVDPVNPAHVVVGERNGDTVDVRLNEAGVWESTDGGLAWSYVLDPLAMPGGCWSQAIPSVAFTTKSTLIVATACGIARRLHPRVFETGPKKSVFTFPQMPAGFQLITALAVAPHRVWARLLNGDLMSSLDDGATWIAVAAPRPPVSFPQRGESVSLGGFDTAAVMPSSVPSTAYAPGRSRKTPTCSAASVNLI